METLPVDWKITSSNVYLRGEGAGFEMQAHRSQKMWMVSARTFVFHPEFYVIVSHENNLRLALDAVHAALFAAGVVIQLPLPELVERYERLHTRPSS